MRINPSYPYPVLAKNNDDYEYSTFNAHIDVRDEFGELILEVTFMLDNDEIKKLIEINDCVYAIHVACSPTSYRQVYKTTQENLLIKIPIKELRGKIEIHTFILANNKIENYSNASLNDWYEGIPLTLEKGNIVSIGDVIETTLFQDNMELLDLPSIVDIAQSETHDVMEVELGSNQITIFLPEYEYVQYVYNAHLLLKSTIMSTVIFPALIQVLSKVNENPLDYEEYTWYQVLEKIFEENNMRLEEVGTDSLSALSAAQKILRNPLKESFEEIEKINKMREEE